MHGRRWSVAVAGSLVFALNCCLCAPAVASPQRTTMYAAPCKGTEVLDEDLSAGQLLKLDAGAMADCEFSRLENLLSIAPG
ncbi:hypothetical protein ACFQVC_22695 [Streptomyces monticola]|uniref:Uncharacterized protein n=1 Tax=Streptomyces monticola TaxID=2666263 RepID=A0ABW2JN69_9ACTN